MWCPTATCNALIILPFSMTFRKRGKQTVPQVNGLATNVCTYNATCETYNKIIKMYMCIKHSLCRIVCCRIVSKLNGTVKINVNTAPCMKYRSSSSPVGMD